MASIVIRLTLVCDPITQDARMFSPRWLRRTFKRRNKRFRIYAGPRLSSRGSGDEEISESPGTLRGSELHPDDDRSFSVLTETLCRASENNQIKLLIEAGFFKPAECIGVLGVLQVDQVN